MYKSWSDDEEKHEWNDIAEPKHIADVWVAIANGFDKYFPSLVASKAPPHGESVLAHLGQSPAFKLTAPKKPSAPAFDASSFTSAIQAYDKEAPKYREFFDTDMLREYREDDPDSFKAMLSRKCPVIRKCTQSKREELKEWNIRYKLTPSEVLLTKFENLVFFANDYLGTRGDESEYAEIDDPDDIGFESVEEEQVGVPGVIGGGIRTRVLHNLDARVFPDRSGTALYGMYFLSGMGTFGLRSKTSEFLMVDDKVKNPDRNIKMDHNFWYPYRIFTIYALRIARRIEEECAKRSLCFDTQYRYVYVDALLHHVCDQHRQDLSVMRGQDEAYSAM
ncbi:hypothetical protein KEG38_32215 [Polyangium jinanense]|uniref:hypothetical protein n=1 Tax=Polyangium jinanense TaxID=2829994 RepID=UPI002340B9EF|nr:hypothetical protein [Polyangium jinanense]MDC3958565.1 hypothetical protein [Polyangium jinanense]